MGDIQVNIHRMTASFLLLWHYRLVRRQISLPNRIVVVQHKGYVLKLQKRSSRSILTAAFCHLVFERAILNDVISTNLIKGRDRKLVLQFKE